MILDARPPPQDRVTRASAKKARSGERALRVLSETRAGT